jgi:hypothetical protein
LRIRTPVHPDERIAKRFSRFVNGKDGGGMGTDTDASYGSGVCARAPKQVVKGNDDGRPPFFGVLLRPPRPREACPIFLVTFRNSNEVGIIKSGLHVGRSDIDSQ